MVEIKNDGAPETTLNLKGMGDFMRNMKEQVRTQNIEWLEENINYYQKLKELSPSVEVPKECVESINRYKNNQYVPQNNGEWIEGCYDEWIFIYHPERKLLLMTYGYGDDSYIYERIVIDDFGDDLLTTAEKRVTYIDEEDVEQAVINLATKDWAYGWVVLDWRNKEAIDTLINTE